MRRVIPQRGRYHQAWPCPIPSVASTACLIASTLETIMSEPVGFAVKAAGVDSIRRAMQQAIDKSARTADASASASSGTGGTASRPPKRHLFALVLAQPQAEYARINIFPFEKHWHFRSSYHVTFIFPGFLGDELDSFSDEVFNQVLNWLSESFDDFQYSGLTTVVVFASNAPGNVDVEPMDKSAVLFFDIEEMQEKGYIPQPRQFFEGLIALAKQYPGDDGLWELRNDVTDTTDGKGVIGVFMNTVKETFKKYIHIPDDEVGRSFEVRKYTKMHRGQ